MEYVVRAIMHEATHAGMGMEQFTMSNRATEYGAIVGQFPESTYYRLKTFLKHPASQTQILHPMFAAIGIETATKSEKVKEISMQLRCMTCQNQSIHDSDADFSLQIKTIIKGQIIEGKSEEEIINFLVNRYGEYIAFKPIFNKKNIFLWVFPFLLFIFSSISPSSPIFLLLSEIPIFSIFLKAGTILESHEEALLLNALFAEVKAFPMLET